jgi:type IV fimbrial biogenesis protein FimT
MGLQRNATLMAQIKSQTEPTYSQQWGVTLFELVVTMAIAATLVAAAAPSFRATQRGAAVLTATDELLSALHQTRTVAITRNLPGVVCLTTSNGRCLERTGTAASGWRAYLNVIGGFPAQYDPGEPIVGTGQFATDVAVFGSRTAVTFWPSTRAGTTNTLTVCDRRAIAPYRQVVISQSGRPRLAANPARRVACP